MEFIGYICSILIGISLGLIGGGGSILTVPVLVYLFKVDPILATAYSLFVVGITSAVGSIDYFGKGLVDIKTSFVFGLPSIISVFVTRAYILPAIPSQLFSISNFILTKSLFLLLLFAILMLAAAYNMLKKSNTDESNNYIKVSYGIIVVEGFVVGALTGLVGAGGGFLIIPALVILSKLPMKMAIGTSLVIIAAKSLIGFLAEGFNNNIDWILLSKISLLSIIGIFMGSQLSKSINGEKLKPAFGWFVLIMGIFIIIKELYIN
ncbi:MAG: hypothetical protein RLZZ546_1846 [Bacteroidota bacterium]|jgi:uncharacterized membrane protein YfcA